MISCKKLILIAVVIYFLMNYIKDNNQKLIFGFVAMYAISNVVEGFEDGENGNGDGNGTLVGNNTVDNNGGDSGEQKAPKYMNTGPYDGLCLKTGNKEYWMKSPDETSLVPNEGLYTYLSSQGPIKMRLSDQAALRGPPVDGVKGSPEKMFMWANNVTSPLCCPSTYSTSTGCICSTKNQRDFIAARGMLDALDQNYASVDEVEV